MPSLWRRFTDFVSERILERSEDQPSTPSPEDYGLDGDFIDELPEAPDQPDGSYGPEDLVTITDDFGNTIGTYTWDGWYNLTLVGRATLLQTIGYIPTKTLISLIEEAYDIVWDWNTWKADYDAIHAR